MMEFEVFTRHCTKFTTQNPADFANTHSKGKLSVFITLSRSGDLLTHVLYSKNTRVSNGKHCELL
jgi:hypothetical protein